MASTLLREIILKYMPSPRNTQHWLMKCLRLWRQSWGKNKSFCAAGQNRTDNASLFRGYLDYIIIPAKAGSWALMQDYCWDSPASLYTDPETYALPELARDSSLAEFSPNSPSFSHDRLLDQAPKISGLRSTTELPRHYGIVAENARESMEVR